LSSTRKFSSGILSLVVFLISPYARSCPQEDVVEYCRQKGIIVTAYSPLGSDGSPLQKNPIVTKIAEKHNVQPANILVSLQANRPGVTVIPKSGMYLLLFLEILKPDGYSFQSRLSVSSTTSLLLSSQRRRSTSFTQLIRNTTSAPAIQAGLASARLVSLTASKG
jgi:hypothetical protein